MRRLLLCTVMMSCAVIVPTAASAQGIPGAPTGLLIRLHGAEAPRTQGEPTTFVLKASEASANAIEAGRLAGTKASSAEIKSFADRLVRDHSRAKADLMEFARARGVAAKPDTATFVTVALNAFSGAGFDRAFVTQVMLDHKVAVALCQEESRSGRDAEIRAWAASTLPTFREHLKHAEDLHARMGTSRE